MAEPTCRMDPEKPIHGIPKDLQTGGMGGGYSVDHQHPWLRVGCRPEVSQPESLVRRVKKLLTLWDRWLPPNISNLVFWQERNLSTLQDLEVL